MEPLKEDIELLKRDISDLKRQIEDISREKKTGIINRQGLELELNDQDALLESGFLRYDSKLTLIGGASGNTFDYMLAKYKNETVLLPMSTSFRQFTANASTDVCTSPNHGFSDDQQVILFTTGTLPGGLTTFGSFYIKNSTQDTFKLSSDGVNPVNITDSGTGTHYAEFLT